MATPKLYLKDGSLSAFALVSGRVQKQNVGPLYHTPRGISLPRWTVILRCREDYKCIVAVVDNMYGEFEARYVYGELARARSVFKKAVTFFAKQDLRYPAPAPSEGRTKLTPRWAR